MSYVYRHSNGTTPLTGEGDHDLFKRIFIRDDKSVSWIYPPPRSPHRRHRHQEILLCVITGEDDHHPLEVDGGDEQLPVDAPLLRVEVVDPGQDHRPRGVGQVPLRLQDLARQLRRAHYQRDVLRVQMLKARPHLRRPVRTLEAPEWTLEAPEWTLEAPDWTLEAPEWTLEAHPWTLGVPEWTVEAPEWTLEARAW
eukprot:9501775-Pyramimonas_sp.AAC.1